MSDAAVRGLLSQEELEALLTGIEESRRTLSETAAAPAQRGSSLLERQMEEFSVEQSRQLSTQYQRPIRFERFHREALALEDFAESLLPEDRLLRVPLEGGTGFLELTIGRSLFYEWLTLAFGGTATPSRTPIMQRDYSRVELRLMRRIALEIARTLSDALHLDLGDIEPARVQILDIDQFFETRTRPADAQLDVHSFEVRGLGEASRLRVLLPAAESHAVPARGVPAGLGELPDPLLDAPVRLHVEVGCAKVSLRQIASLKVGDSIPLEPAHPEGLLVLVENESKFAAIRGTLRDRLAIQLGSRI